MKFRKEFLQEVVWKDNPDTEIVENEMVETSRWAILHRIVFKYEEKYYISHYRVGATEYQEECPYEYDEDEIECEEVFPVEEIITVWKTQDQINSN